jgi:hypothetical protein
MLVEITATAGEQKRGTKNDTFLMDWPHVPLGEFTRR